MEGDLRGGEATSSSSGQGGSREEGSLGVRDPFRKAMPTLDAQEDVCSICLDEYSQEDPGVSTSCGHSYHLQCIMQWAQRSKECPLCYKDLRLKDPDLHASLPFGEYVRKDRESSNNGLMEDWELDSLLQRIALQAYPGGHRRTRSKHRDRHSDVSAASANPASASRSIAVPQSVGREGSRTTTEQSSDYPGSWPPRVRSNRTEEVEDKGDPPLRSNVSADLRSAGESLKSRWSSFQAKCRESFSGRSSGVAK